MKTPDLAVAQSFDACQPGISRARKRPLHRYALLRRSCACSWPCSDQQEIDSKDYWLGKTKRIVASPPLPQPHVMSWFLESPQLFDAPQRRDLHDYGVDGRHVQIISPKLPRRVLCSCSRVEKNRPFARSHLAWHRSGSYCTSNSGHSIGTKLWLRSHFGADPKTVKGASGSFGSERSGSLAAQQPRGKARVDTIASGTASGMEKF